MALTLLLAALPGFLDTLPAQYAFTGWCSGPDTIAGLLWAPAIFENARADQLCGSIGGISSGADGERCTEFNETMFKEYGGSACLLTNARTESNYRPDPALPGCLEAFAAYRNATANETTPFTCDCEGDYAFLGGTGGLRSGTVFIISNVVGTVAVAVLGPAVGTWIDHHGGKFVWKLLLIIAGCGMLGQAALEEGYIWLIGLCISVFTIIASELVTIPRQAYLEDLPEAQVPSVSGQRIILSYVSQILFVIIAVVLTLFLSTTLSSSIITVVAGLWYLGFFGIVIPKFPTRPPTREAGGRGVCAIGYGQLFADLLELKNKYPQALKYLGFLFLIQNGLGTTALSIANSFTIEQLKMSSLQVQVMFVIVLIFGLPWTYAFKLIATRLPMKRILLLVILIWVAAILIVGLLVNNLGVVDGEWTVGYIIFLVVAALLLAPGLTWWYSAYWVAFLELVPAAQVNQFAGIFTMVRTLGLIPQPLIYVATSQAFTSAADGRQAGLLIMLAWDVVALPLLLWVDYAEGRRQAGRGAEPDGVELRLSTGDGPKHAPYQQGGVSSAI